MVIIQEIKISIIVWYKIQTFKKKCKKKIIKPHGNHSFKSLIACGNSGSLISLICCGIFIFFTAEIALVGAADNPA